MITLTKIMVTTRARVRGHFGATTRARVMVTILAQHCGYDTERYVDLCLCE
jgi:hypothetical protein